MHEPARSIHVRTTLDIVEKLLAQAVRLTEIEEKKKPVRLGLEALIARGSALRRDGGGRRRERRAKHRLDWAGGQ